MLRSELVDSANAVVLERLYSADPILVDILPAGEAIPDYDRATILTSGPDLDWPQYTGGQRSAIIGATIFEGLARDASEAVSLLDSGSVRVHPCYRYNCIGSLAGVYTASMPVLVVHNKTHGNFSYCNFYEGTNPRRLNYGVYDDGVRDRLLEVQTVVAPALQRAIRLSGGIKLKPIMERALHMGDELHSRNTAASLLFSRELFMHFLEVASTHRSEVQTALNALNADHYFFLRLSMAAAKATADAMQGIHYSSIVTAMIFNCREFAIRVSGLDNEWFKGPHPEVTAKLFSGHTQDEITWMGGESTVIDTIGLGGLAQAAAFPLQAYQGGSPGVMIANNLEMYKIVVGEHPTFKIPYFGYRGTPAGIDLRKVVATGITPIMNIGIAGKGGGQIGAGLVRANMRCFELALAAFSKLS